MGIALSSNFDLSAQLPLDARQVKATTVARDAIPAVERYDGLIVYVLADSKNYQLQGGIDNADWVDISSSGGSSSFTGLTDTPASISTSQYLRGNTGGTALEFRTIANVLSDIGAVPTSRTVTGINSISGGGALSSDRTFQLINDEDAPGEDKYYGTDDNGEKGYFSLPVDGVPIGAILMWSGTIASIPTGYFLCDGNNNTPDLRDRFIVGARQDDAGVAKTNVTGSLTTTGGAATHTLTVAEMPVHTHVQDAHWHQILRERSSTSGTQSTQIARTADTSSAIDTNVYTENTTATNQNAGSGSAHNNLPPYYALAFIIRSDYTPSAPDAPVATAADQVEYDGFRAKWNASTGATSYRLDVSNVNDFSSYIFGYEDWDVGNVTTRTVFGLDEKTTYYYRIRAVNGIGTSGNSNTIDVTTDSAPALPPDTPTNLSVISDNTTGVSASWDSSSGATYYEYQFSVDGGAYSSWINNADNTFTYIGGYSPGQTICVRVRACNTNGCSFQSFVVCDTI